MPTLEERQLAAAAAARLRTELTGNPDAPDAVPEECEQCSATFYRPKGRRRHYCPTCSAERAVAGGRQMAERRGPAYEAWLVRTHEHVTREMERLGLLTAEPK